LVLLEFSPPFLFLYHFFVLFTEVGSFRFF